MRLITYLNENDTLKLYEKVKKECNKYLSDIKGSDYFLIRYDSRNTNAYKKKIRKDRVPRDTPKIIHDMMNKSLKKKFGWNVRSEGLFCYSSSSTRKFSGDAFLVFPVGNYEFVWSSKIDDITSLMAKKVNLGPISMKNKIEQKHLDILKDYWNKDCLNTYSNKSIKNAMKSGNEISVKCDEAYLIKKVQIKDFD